MRWVNAGELTVGATMCNAAGEVGVVEALVVVDAPQTMYNLTVELVATYVVGAGQWVVHNQEYPPQPSILTRVQGGIGPSGLSNTGSLEILELLPDGNIRVNYSELGDRHLWVTFNNPERSLEYLLENRPGGYLLQFDIDANFVDVVTNLAKRQRERQNFMAQYNDELGKRLWRNFPQIGDFRLSLLIVDGQQIATSFGIPSSWVPAMTKAICPNSGVRIDS